jgi:ABC-type Zn uptake system ZnuABC Zn-binding protein ZnuA
MSRQSQRALVASLMMILASLAGCIGTDDLDLDDDASSLGTVMVSTYHISELVSAVGGDLVEVEMISTTNMPVHDFEPSAQDIIRLQGADVFLYHGLGLEPWVDGALDSMGSDAPLASATHAMPDGAEALDFESLLIDELCRYLAGPSTTDVHLLAEHAEDADELHGEAGAYNLAMPEHEEEHHDEEEGEHDEDHDEHDHEGDGHVEPLEMISTAGSDCPAETVVSIYHLEEGEYVLEFEAEDMEAFTMAMAAMAGAHDHAHEHGEHEDGHHDEDGFCYDEVEDTEWSGWDSETMNESDCLGPGLVWIVDDGHGDEDHDDEMTAEEALSEFDTNNDSSLSWDEFWVAWNMDDDDHDDHDHEEGEHDENETSDGDEHDHEEEHSPLEEALEDYMMEMLMTMFNESDADNSGGLSLEELEHFIEDIDTMEDEDIGMPGGEFIVGAFDEDSDNMLSFDEFSEMMGMSHDEHDGNETHDENESAEEELMEAMMEMMFNMSDANSDGFLNASEVVMMFEMMDNEEDHAEEEGVGFIHLHVEREGDYGIALPAGVELHVLSEGGHEGHDHDEHAHEEEDEHHDEHAHDEEDEHHDEEEGEHHDEEEGEHHDEDEDGHDEDDHDDHGDDAALEFDPHSWLNPMAFAAQIDVVSGVLSTAFPEGAETFKANADAYNAKLTQLDADYEAAFGATGTCSDTTVAANHNAYAYMADAYDLEFVTVHGLDPEGEPSAEDIAEVVERISEDEITVLFVEEYTDASAVESLVQQTTSDTMPNGVQVLTLYTMEMAPMDSNDDYMSLMTKNLENLKTGLGC